MMHFFVRFLVVCGSLIYLSTYTQEAPLESYKSLFTDRTSMLAILPRDIQGLIAKDVDIFECIESKMPDPKIKLTHCSFTTYHIQSLLQDANYLAYLHNNQALTRYNMRQFFGQENLDLAIYENRYVGNAFKTEFIGPVDKDYWLHFFQSGANPNAFAKKKGEYSFIYYRAALQLIKEFIHFGGNINSKREEIHGLGRLSSISGNYFTTEDSPLRYYAELGDIHAVKTLLDHGADPTMTYQLQFFQNRQEEEARRSSQTLSEILSSCIENITYKKLKNDLEQIKILIDDAVIEWNLRKTQNAAAP